ncbi:hypothetical protein BO70DRAFT_379656 [Aspergillus heteromorphus CBS 117.55]|uniref:Uncharacterized protein n=1 Tax=Aspergillus heteromorphus CBS 117.55 TaxID=1448321 RepID=A0A317WAW1_9EURO|nr:uncharacterized protein BO70DRAFT_379656 [Aspergillus heteromorphus CBS 117.55]PWY82138.1 hypothetical protein BO70DRAFT_379656 [Aspergillus heteromorphus CBS 117.55]
MANKKKAKLRKLALARPPNDPKPAITEYPQPLASPYLTPTATLRIGQSSFKVPEYFLRPYPVFAVNSLDMRLNVHEDIGHTVVHFLCTGAYETIRPDDSGPWSCPFTREFERSVYAYHAAKIYGLQGLEKHAKRYMQRFGHYVTTLQVLTVARSVYADHPDKDFWFRDFVRQKLINTFQAGEEDLIECVSNYGVGTEQQFDQFLVKTVLEIFRDRMVALRDATSNGYGVASSHCDAPDEEEVPDQASAVDFQETMEEIPEPSGPDELSPPAELPVEFPPDEPPVPPESPPPDEYPGEAPPADPYETDRHDQFTSPSPPPPAQYRNDRGEWGEWGVSQPLARRSPSPPPPEEPAAYEEPTPPPEPETQSHTQPESFDWSAWTVAPPKKKIVTVDIKLRSLQEPVEGIPVPGPELGPEPEPGPSLEVF